MGMATKRHTMRKMSMFLGPAGATLISNFKMNGENITAALLAEQQSLAQDSDG